MRLSPPLRMIGQGICAFTMLVALLSTVLVSIANSQPTLSNAAPTTQAAPEQLKLYCVGYTHLDTQWRWSYPQVISEFLRNTLRDNFALFQKYPHYIFNFTGANRYMMFKEYYPEDYQKLKQFIAAGRWFPGGSSVEEGDVNMPDGEAIIRQVLYGNEYFRREFGKQSCEFMLPDCFGFQASLPSLLAHCGLKGFSTQKLTWSSAVGIPFNVGVWEGPDGGSIVAALNPGDYNSSINEDLSRSQQWEQRIQKDGQESGASVDYHYYGLGDRGGAPPEQSLEWLEKSIASGGPVHVISANSEQMFVDLTPEQIAKLPKYKGDLLLTNHSAGSITSQSFIKRCNRKIEELADAAERASVAANWLGDAPYPVQKIYNAWILALGAHFHDTMAGTALPKANEYSWNNQVLALNQFAAVAQDGAGAVIRGMNTQAQGVPVVVFNPLSIEREDVAEATLSMPQGTADSVSVFAPDGTVVPSQVLKRDGQQVKILFLAKVPSVGFATYDVRATDSPMPISTLSINNNALENDRFRVTVNADGDIESIYDKTNQRQVLSAPARLALLHENPTQFPAWEMDWEDRVQPPYDYIHGPCKIRVIENGPVRVALEVDRQAGASRFVQQIRLAAGAAGDRIEVATSIDWQTHESSLKATFPLTVSNSLATYESQSAAVQRGNNDPKKFEVPQQQWLDLSAADGSYGAAILNDCKYGSDKPADNTVRLTLLYTPGVRQDFQDQATQDFGRHEMTYAIAPHAGTWQQSQVPQSQVPWQAERLNQPLMAFQAAAHDGPLGRSFSLLKINNMNVKVMALKKAEDGDETIVRLHEVNGEPSKDVRVTFAAGLASAREVDGQERPIGKAKIVDGALALDMTPFELRAFAVKLNPPHMLIDAPLCQSVPLRFDIDAVSRHENLSDGSFDEEGRTFAAEAFPPKIVSEGIEFTMGSVEDGKNNAMSCRGQKVELPAEGFDRLYLLAAAIDGDQPVTIDINGHPTHLTVQDWSGFIGQWDNRVWSGTVPALTYSWDNQLVGLVPGFIKRDTVAWFCSHRHHPSGGNEYYRFTYLFKYAVDLPSGAKSITLGRNERVRIFAMTLAKHTHDNAIAALPLYDTLQDRAGDLPAPGIEPEGRSFNQCIQVQLTHPLYWRERGLHYTLDGSEPTAESPLYSDPIWITQRTTLRAKEIDANGRAGAEGSAVFDVNDTTPPFVVSASAFAVVPRLAITFSERVRHDQAEQPGNYHFEPAMSVQSAQLCDDGMHCILTLRSNPTAAEGYKLRVSDVCDLSPAANPVTSKPVEVTITRPILTVDYMDCSDGPMERHVSTLPIHADDQWTMNLFARTSKPLEDLTIIAGFGAVDDSAPDGTGRYFSKFSNGIHFWSRHADVDSSAALDLDCWQMLTATYDGLNLRIYNNAQPIGQRQITFKNDEAVIHLAPLDPWEHRRRFQGEICNFSLWKKAMAVDEIRTLQTSRPDR